MGAVRTDLPDLFTGPEAQARGWTRHQVEWAARSGRWRRLRRGIYAVQADYDSLDPVGRHLLECRAALRVHDERHVLSHVSAALSYGLPVPLAGTGRPTLTIGTTKASTDRQDDLVVQVASLREQDVTRWTDGLRTRPARTVADCLRHLPRADAVAVGDAALHLGLTDLRAIDAVLRWQDGWPYLLRGRAAYALLDGRRENWLESFSAVSLYDVGIPLGVPQVDVYDAHGSFIGRVDGYWPDHATVGEADGRAKYALSADGGDRDQSGDLSAETVRRSLIREKEREDRLRDAGLEVVRWGTADIVHRPERVAEALRRAFRRGDPSRFSGSLRLPSSGPLAVEPGWKGLPYGA